MGPGGHGQLSIAGRGFLRTHSSRIFLRAVRDRDLESVATLGIKPPISVDAGGQRKHQGRRQLRFDPPRRLLRILAARSAEVPPRRVAQRECADRNRLVRRCVNPQYRTREPSMVVRSVRADDSIGSLRIAYLESGSQFSYEAFG